MKKNLFILLMLATLVMPTLLQAAQPTRVWKSKFGKTFTAALDDPKDDDEPGVVYLLRNGNRYPVPLNKLSPKDQNYVHQVRGGQRSSIDDELWKDFLEDDVRGLEIVPSGNQYVLLIGVNHYSNSIKSLNYCMNDMTLLAETYKKIGVPEENIFLVVDDSSPERRPTRANIRQQILNITQMMEPNDRLTIAFSGHGVAVKGKSYLCPSDTNLKDINTLISRDWAFAQLENCKAKQKIFIIDACRNEMSFDGQKSLEGVKFENPIESETHGFILIASCDKTQRSWEDAKLQHGVFTYYLAEGLAGEAKDEDGYVSILSLFQYASRKTKTYVSQTHNTLQVPTMKQGGEITDFCLVKLEVPVITQTVATNVTANATPTEATVNPPIIQPERPTVNPPAVQPEPQPVRYTRGFGGNGQAIGIGIGIARRFGAPI